MKTHFKISLAVMSIALILAIGFSIPYGIPGFLVAFGAACCIGGTISLLLAAIFGMIGGEKGLARAFLLAAGITFLVGTGTCSTLFIAALAPGPH